MIICFFIPCFIIDWIVILRTDICWVLLTVLVLKPESWQAYQQVTDRGCPLYERLLRYTTEVLVMQKCFYQTIKPSEWQKLDTVSSEVAHQVVSLGAVFFYCISMVFLPCKCSYILLCNLISLKNVKWNLKSDSKTHIFQ